VTCLVYESAADVSSDQTQDNPGAEGEGGILPSIGKHETQRGDIDY
jgi:hypothetical protein